MVIFFLMVLAGCGKAQSHKSGSHLSAVEFSKKTGPGQRRAAGGCEETGRIPERTS